jgi:hypothetical protein
MRRLLVIVVAAAAFAVGALAFGGRPNIASADDTSAAAHFKGFSCHIFLPAPVGFLVTTDTHSVTQRATPDGNSLTTCHFEGPAVDHTIIETGFGCSTDLGTTFQTRIVYTPSGHGTLTCLNNPAGP